MSFLPPPPVRIPLHPPAPPRLGADSNAAKLTIPYLGPEPPRSRPAGGALQILCGAAALLFVVKAIACTWQARLEQDFLDHPTKALADQVRSGNQRLGVIGTISFVSVLAVIVGDLIWRSHRRPKQRRSELGEAYVEFPLKWVTPIAIRVAWVVLGVGAGVASFAGTVNRTTIPTDYPLHRQLLALSSLTWAGLFLSFAVWVVLVNHSHERRVAWSIPYRNDPSQVPFFPSVAGIGVIDTGRGPRSSAGGIGWVLSTAGLIILVFLGVGALVGGGAAVSNGYLVGLPWMGVGAVLVGLVVWVMVRRYQQGRL